MNIRERFELAYAAKTGMVPENLKYLRNKDAYALPHTSGAWLGYQLAQAEIQELKDKLENAMDEMRVMGEQLDAYAPE